MFIVFVESLLKLLLWESQLYMNCLVFIKRLLFSNVISWLFCSDGSCVVETASQCRSETSSENSGSYG